MENRRSNILKICHIADIHIRSTQRHDEYRRVFKNLRIDIEKRGVDVVWIGGDIFHTKLSGISPEYISLLYNTLRSLREVAEVHMMLGNHDGNLANLDRMDAVSPIIDIMNDSRVKLYKHSGVYPLNDRVNWCVYSPFDPENWKNVQPQTERYNIACFHGAVSGARTASDWEMKGEKSVSDFDKFDIALLGDIHKMQYLGGHNPPRIAYPGSLIQQSYDEELDHGYLLWTIDLSNNEHQLEFVKIDGANPFVTVRVNEKNYKSIASSDLKDLENVRCRLICEDLTIAQRSSLKEALSSFKVHEVVILEDQKSEKNVKKRISEAVKLDTVDSLIKQAKHFAEHNVKTNALWEDIEFEIRSYVDRLKIGTNKAHRWTVKNLIFDNLYSYAENNRIDFEDFSGLVGIIGPNASGKSSVLGSLLYSLFNTSDRDCTKNAFYINDDKDSSSTHCTIEVDGIPYEIIRSSVRSSTNRDASSTKLILKSKNSNMTGEQRNDTDKVIKELIGSVEDFMLTSIAVQEDLGKFLKEGSTARKEIVSRFLGIDCLSDIHFLAKKEMNALKTERKTLSSLPIAMMKDELSRFQKMKIEFDQKLIEKESIRDTISDNIQKIESEMFRGNSSTMDRESLKKEIDKLIILKKNISDQISELESSNIVFQAEIDELNIKIASIDAISIAEKMKNALSLKDSMNSAKSDLNLAEQHFRSAEKSALKLLDVPCGDSFPTCKFITDSHKDKSSLNELAKQVCTMRDLVSDFESRISVLRIEDLLSKNKLRDDLTKKKEKIQQDLNQSTTIISSRKESLIKVEDKIKVYLDQFNTVDDEKLNRLKKEKEQRTQIQSEINALYVNCGSLKKEIDIFEKQVQSCSVLDSRMDLLEAITEIFSKDGLPRFIMSQHLDHINVRMNDLLSKIVDFTVELRMDDEKGNLDVILKKRGRKRIAELGSGMERTLISLALRVALRDISCIPMPDFFIVDEGFSMLDGDNVMACKNLLLELKKIFKFVVVMTHNDDMKEMMDKIVEVSMSKGFSKLDGGKN